MYVYVSQVTKLLQEFPFPSIFGYTIFGCIPSTGGAFSFFTFNSHSVCMCMCAACVRWIFDFVYITNNYFWFGWCVCLCCFFLCKHQNFPDKVVIFHPTRRWSDHCELYGANTICTKAFSRVCRHTHSTTITTIRKIWKEYTNTHIHT